MGVWMGDVEEPEKEKGRRGCRLELEEAKKTEVLLKLLQVSG